jgi:N-dimethylarginine dimethylaminohydrolase
MKYPGLRDVLLHSGFSFEDATIIERCVNSHDALVEALKMCLEEVEILEEESQDESPSLQSLQYKIAYAQSALQNAGVK